MLIGHALQGRIDGRFIALGARENDLRNLMPKAVRDVCEMTPEPHRVIFAREEWSGGNLEVIRKVLRGAWRRVCGKQREVDPAG